jgi:hypothetical protein
VFVADTGSGAHAIYAREGTEVVDAIADNPQESPIQQCMRLVKKWTEEGLLWAVDSFSTMIEQQVMWHKKHRTGNQQMSLREHQHVVGDLRDLALFLASRPGFTLFNTSPGGQQRTPEGQIVNIPKGILVGYPALSGLAEGKETVLSRFTTSWVATPGAIANDKRAKIARGFILPWHDIRGSEIGNFAPIKDPLRVLAATKVYEGTGDDRRVVREEEVDAFLTFDPASEESCTIDVMLDRIAETFPHIRKNETGAANANAPRQPPQLGVVEGGEPQRTSAPPSQAKSGNQQRAAGGGNRGV